MNVYQQDNIQFFVDNAEIIQEHQVYQLIQNQNNAINFMYFSCNNNTINIYNENDQQLQFYFTQDNTGYVYQDNCNSSDTQICNVTLSNKQQQITLKPGLWRGTVYFTQNDTLRFNQTQIFNLDVDSSYQDFEINTVNYCKAYINVSVAEYYTENQDYIRKLSMLATHKNQLKEGGIDIQLYEDYPISQDHLYQQSNHGNITIGPTDIKIMTTSERQYFFITLGQVNNRFIHTTNISLSQAQIMIQYNLDINTVGSIGQSSFMKPFYLNETDKGKIEIGTRRYAYNFYYDLPKITAITNLLDNQTQTANLQYIFGAVSISSVQCNQTITIDSLNGEQITTQYPMQTDLQILQGTYAKLQASTKTDLSQDKIVADSVVFQNLQLVTPDDQKDQQIGGLISSGKAVLELDVDSEIEYYTGNITQGLSMIIHPNQQLSKSGKYIIKAYSCSPSDRLSLYWSWKDIIVSKYDHLGEYTDQGDQYLEIDAENLVDPLYLNILHSESCYVKTQILSNADVEVIEEGESMNVQLDGNETKVIQVKQKQLYNKGSNMFLRANVINNQEDKQPVQVSVAVTNQIYYGDAQNANPNILLSYGILSSENNIYNMQQKFINKNEDYIYVILRNKLDSQCQLQITLSQPIELENDKLIVFQQRKTTAIIGYVERIQDQTQKLQVTFNEDKNVEISFCPYSLPYINQLDNCITIQLNQSSTIDLDQYLQQGDNFLIFNLQQDDLISVKLIQSTVVYLNQAFSQTMNGNQPQYYQVNMKQEDNSYLQLQLHQCTNCYICISDTYEHPQVYLANLSQNQCNYQIGNTQNDFINLTQIEDVYTQQDKVYLTVVSLNPLSSNQQIIFGAYQKVNILPDTYYNSTIAYGEPLQLSINLQKQNEMFRYTSIMFNPIIDEDVFVFEEPQYNIFITDDDSLPNYGNAKYQLTAQLGNPSLMIKNSELFKDRQNVTLNIKIEMLEDAVFSPIKCNVIVGFQNQTMNINQQLFGEQTEYQSEANKSSVSTYNISFVPSTVMLEKCYGNPHMRIGTNDFFNELNFESEETQYNNKSIYYPTNDNENYSYISINDENQVGKQIYIQTYSTNSNYDVQFTVGNNDLRPGASIQTIKVMKKDKKVVIRIHPASDYTNKQQPIYAIYAAKNYKDKQYMHENPFVSCGIMKGIQLSEWQQVDQNQSFVDIFSDDAKIQLQNLEDFYITVVVKSQISHMTNSYQVEQFTWDSIPDYDVSDEQSNATGLIIGISIGIVALILIIFGIVYYIKKKQAGNPYAFAVQKDDIQVKPTIQI